MRWLSGRLAIDLGREDNELYAEIITILLEFEREVGSFDQQLIPMAIEAGEEATLEQLPYIRRLLSENQ